jgi:hypothetical protein
MPEILNKFNTWGFISLFGNYFIYLFDPQTPLHRRQEPFCVDHKTYAKLSTFVKYVIKFVGRANPIANFEFAEEYVKYHKQNTYLIFIFLPYPIPNVDYVSHTRFNCVVIAKPFRYLNYEENYVSTAYLTTYLDFVVATQSMSS